MLPKFLSIVGIAAKLLPVLLPVVEAQTTTAVCIAAYSWMDNTRGQNPCLVAAYAQGACNGGQFTVDPLVPDTHYTGPWLDQVNPCECSTVAYSLVSACGICQNRTIETWSAWRFNCSQVYPQQFPEPIPSGTSIPAWAYLDVVTGDVFNVGAAQADDTAPESSATSSKPTATVSSIAASTVSTIVASVTPTSGVNGGGAGAAGTSKKKSNAGAIAGGVVGGLVGLGGIAALVAFLFMRSRRSKTAPSASYGNVYNGAPRNDAPLNSPPPMSQPSYTNQTPRLYDPSDPSTYPQPPQTPTIHTTNSGPVINPYGQQPQPGHYSGVPEL